MTAPQPTHDQAHEASLQERERGREVLIAGLRESNRAMRAEVLKLRDELISAVGERDQNRKDYFGQCGHTADALAKRDELAACLGIADAEIAQLRAQLATLSSARQSDRELVDDVDVRELRRKIEAQAKHITELERVRKREQAIAAGQINTARNETRQVEGTLKLRDATIERLEERVEAASRELVELRERAEGAERRVHELEARFDDMGNPLDANELQEKLSAAETKLAEYEIRVVDTESALEKWRAFAQARTGCSIYTDREYIENLNGQCDHGVKWRTLQTATASTTPAEQPEPARAKVTLTRKQVPPFALGEPDCKPITEEAYFAVKAVTTQDEQPGRAGEGKTEGLDQREGDAAIKRGCTVADCQRTQHRWDGVGLVTRAGGAWTPQFKNPGVRMDYLPDFSPFTIVKEPTP